MDLFYLLGNEKKRIAPPISPERPGRLLHRERRAKRVANVDVPSLINDENYDSRKENNEATSPHDREKREIFTIEERLQKARTRREEKEREREIALNVKNHQAFIRAQQNIEFRRERFRKETSRVANVCARRNVMEENQRRHALASIENKLSGAVSRAEQLSKKKQAKARHGKRVERARKKRELSEFERRSALLSSVGRRTHIAEKNVQQRLLTRQFRAREEIERAQEVSLKIKSVRVIQRAARKMLGIEKVFNKSFNSSTLSEHDAALRLQFSYAWRTKVVCQRLNSTPNDSSSTILGSLKTMMSAMGHFDSKGSNSMSFEHLSASMRSNEVIVTTQKFIEVFDPVLGGLHSDGTRNLYITDRTILSSFLVSQQPYMVLGPNRTKDRCSRLLEAASRELTSAMSDLVQGKPGCLAHLIPKVTSNLISYCTLFHKWKAADIEQLVAQMKKSAKQSWISFILSKEATSYAQEKAKLIEGKHGDPFFQHNIRYKSSRKGASSHIKRIRASLDKLIGTKEGYRIMKEAKHDASKRIEEDGMIENTRNEIDGIVDAHVAKSGQDFPKAEDSDVKFNLEDSDALESVNEHIVHEILLTDKEDLRTQLLGNKGESIADNITTFMDKFRNQKKSSDNSAQTAEDFAFTMERAFFDKILDEWISHGDMSGIKEMLNEMFQKMRNLVPKRKDLHNYFTTDHAYKCQDASEILALLLRIGEVMGESLESPYRAESTMIWYKKAKGFESDLTSPVPFRFQNIESFSVGSIAFLVKKLDLCHADLVNFRLLKMTPLILHNGLTYERQRFREKYGDSTGGLVNTKHWVDRISLSTESWSSVISSVKDGFVDELLFVKEQISMPEILSLDSGRVGSIRERTKRSVVVASLFIHVCNIFGRSMSSLSESLKSKMNFFKAEVISLLKSHLSYEDLRKKVIDELVSLAQAVFNIRNVEGTRLDKIASCTTGVLQGSDRVFRLMDKRVRNIFRVACKFEKPKVSPPMRTGIQDKSKTSSNNTGEQSSQKTYFTSIVTKETKKMGFNAVVDELVDVTYDAFKVIDHCISVHESTVLMPIVKEKNEQSREE